MATMFKSRATSSSYEWVKTEDLSCDPEYQRDVHPSLVKKFVTNFDEFRVGTLHVSRRSDGQLVVLDGQHRFLAAKQVGEKTIHCVVKFFATTADEAAEYDALNTDRRPLTTMDRWKTEMVAGKERTLVIHDLIQDRDSLVTNSHGVQAVRTLWTIHDKRGADHLEEILDVLYEAFGALSAESCQSRYLSGVDEFLRLHPEKRDRLVKKLQEGGPGRLATLTNMYRTSGAGRRAGYVAMVQICNHQARNQIIVGQKS